MGILKDEAEYVIASALGNGMNKISESVSKLSAGVSKSQKRTEKNDRLFMKMADMKRKHPDRIHFAITEEMYYETGLAGFLSSNYGPKSDYYIYSDDGQLCYKAKGGNRDRRQKIEIVDANESKVAGIIEKTGSIEVIYQVSIRTNSYGSVHGSLRLIQPKLFSERNNWTIHFMPAGYRVIKEENKVIAEIFSENLGKAMIVGIRDKSQIEYLLALSIMTKVFYKTWHRKRTANACS